jgi:hypothetical protein
MIITYLTFTVYAVYLNTKDYMGMTVICEFTEGFVLMTPFVNIPIKRIGVI